MCLPSTPMILALIPIKPTVFTAKFVFVTNKNRPWLDHLKKTTHSDEYYLIVSSAERTDEVDRHFDHVHEVEPD